MDSRIIPPWAAVATIMPALGGPSSTTSHCSGEKAAFVVIRYSCPHCWKHGLLERTSANIPRWGPPDTRADRSNWSQVCEPGRAQADTDLDLRALPYMPRAV